VLLVLISSQFDYTPGAAGYMNADVWKRWVNRYIVYDVYI
jgi:hypothetical protein